MATVTGQSSKTSGGGYIESRITYTVSDNIATITELEVRKQPNSLTQPTSGTWKYEIGYNWDNAQKSGSVSKSVSTSWVTLWSGTVKVNITENGGSDNVIYGTVTAPTGTSYEGLSARAGIQIDYEKPAPPPTPTEHILLVYHYYVGGGAENLLERQTYKFKHGTTVTIKNLALNSDDYVYQYAEDSNGTRITSLTINDSQDIYLYYKPAAKWYEKYHSNTGDTHNNSFNFNKYEVHCWFFRTASPGTLSFSSTGSADTIGWISSSRNLSVDDSGYPTNGSYIKKDDDSGENRNFSITYNVEDENGKDLYLYVSILNGEPATNVKINVSFERLTRNVQIDYYVLSGSSSSIKDSKFPTVYYGGTLSPSDYIENSDLGAGCTFKYAVIRGSTITADNISSVSYTITSDERWDFYYTKLRWTWEGANRTTPDAASASETIQAYNALSGKGRTDGFSHKVWNDLCAVTQDALKSKSATWNSKYATYDNTIMSTSPYTLTAVRFNSLRLNIDQIANTGIGEKTKYNGVLLDSNKVIGNEFIILTNCLNRA